MIDRQATAVRRKRYDCIAPVYDLMELMNERRMRPWREKLWAQVPPVRVLEVGVGTGKNFEFHPRDAHMTGIDFSLRMLERARRRAAQLGEPIELCQMDAQAMEFPDGSFDAAAATCVFCSVPDPVLGLQEVKRVVKPGGRVFLMEHMRHANPIIGKLMDILNPLARWMGPDINRRTLDNVCAAGLEIEHVEDLGMGSIFKLIVARVPHG
jgi:ubiquinone/menaquinone biosynthesis C-methylase UbiE